MGKTLAMLDLQHNTKYAVEFYLFEEPRSETPFVLRAVTDGMSLNVSLPHFFDRHNALKLFSGIVDDVKETNIHPFVYLIYIEGLEGLDILEQIFSRDDEVQFHKLANTKADSLIRAARDDYDFVYCGMTK